ncbi:MAG: isoleucine--tRNA ligase, partial [Planctomycetes bacterium]|nr:isoleucine--tRNA ligase [Planctomycetota bacterium]
MTFAPVPADLSFPDTEREVSTFWKEKDIFAKSLEARAGCQPFVFYEGPPTANGKPHPGHVLTRVVKDLFPRYKTMRGFRVPRKAGWDTHGLPVEIEVEKELGISGKAEIEEYGVEDFTRRCIDSVFRYTREWEELTERIGFWVDLDAYVTFHRSYVESVWWSLKRLFDKGLLYQDRKIVWWWAQGGTTLSAAEVGLGYRTVADPSVYVRFRSAEDPRVSYLAWTTTPWTLPSNVALAVNNDKEYVRVEVGLDEGGSETLIMSAELVDKVLTDKVKPLSVSPRFLGKELVGKRYQQLLPYKAPEGGDSCVIVAADFVAVDATQGAGCGTGIVHIAPAFGEDDYRLAKDKNLGFLQLVDDQGRMTPEVTEVAGEFCKAADRELIRRLRRDGLLFREEAYNHDYPFCWRADNDPLIQYARPAWFIGTSRFREEMLANSAAVNWVPSHIREGRFGKFLEGNVDWALSRERYWGTPLPIWRCESTGYVEAIGSYGELLSKPDVQGTEEFEKAKQADPDISDHLIVHKPYIDAVNYQSPKDSSARMRRVPEVIDCWYDSGAMPFAQWGYPHAEGSEKRFSEAFPADFISEAIDQTRGWFYTLLAESTLLNSECAEPHPYRTCIVLGHVCDEKGEKMSKSKRNYLDPNEVLDAHGADALRWYFLGQGHPWTNARFSMDRVGEAKKDFLIRLQNVWSFFVIYANIDGFNPADGNAAASTIEPESLAKSRGYSEVSTRGLMDRWVISELHSTTTTVIEALDRYDVLVAARALSDFVDGLSNWYVRTGRSRFWASGLERDKLDAYWTLYECLATFSRLIAPYVPFFAERLYRNLVVGMWGDSQPESVHLTDYPQPREELVDKALARQMALASEVVALGRSARVEAQIRVRQPLSEAILVLADPRMEPQLSDLLPLIRKELNVEDLRFAKDADKFVDYHFKPNFKLIGPRLGPQVQKLKKVLQTADAAGLRAELDEGGSCQIEVDGEAISLSREELDVQLTPKEGYAARAGRGVVLILETSLTDELREKWYARELVSKVNGLRGERSLAYEARVNLQVWCGDDLQPAFEKHRDHVMDETLSESVEFYPLD